MHPPVLVIAGSDSGGGAGIQGDLKTITALGGHAATAITALTAQNTRGVAGIHEIEPAFIAQQITVVLEDIGAAAIKTGMLHSPAVIETVCNSLMRLAPDTPLVADPVMVAQSGDSLLQADAVEALRTHLLPMASVLTPNVPEAERLLGGRLGGPDDLEDAARRLLALGPRAVLLKGGHLQGDPVRDVLVTAEGSEVFESPRVATKNNHGTGCALASAVATGLAQGQDLKSAVARARRFVWKALAASEPLGSGSGPLNHAHAIPPYDEAG